MHGTTAFKFLHNLVVPSLCLGCHSHSCWTLNAITYINDYVDVVTIVIAGSARMRSVDQFGMQRRSEGLP